MRSLALISSSVLVLALVGCSDDKTSLGADAAPVTNKDATTTSTPGLDATTGLDADPQTILDTGTQSMPDAQPNPIDSGGASLPCDDLNVCCGTLQFQQMACFDRAAMGDQAACQTLLGQIQGGGLCLPAGFDAGEPAEGGVLSPECAALEPCCAQAGALAGTCDNIVQRNNPGTCQQILDLLAGRGIMCTPGTPDAGTIEDAGTATVTDAGTSTVTDAGP